MSEENRWRVVKLFPETIRADQAQMRLALLQPCVPSRRRFSMLRARTPFADSVRRLFCLRCRFPQVVLLAGLAAMAGMAGQARAEDDILKLVPEQALGFVVVNRPAAADAKLQQLGQQMKLPIPSLLAKLQGPNGIRKGLDKNRPIALLVLPPKNDQGLPVMIALSR